MLCDVSLNLIRHPNGADGIVIDSVSEQLQWCRRRAHLNQTLPVAIDGAQ